MAIGLGRVVASLLAGDGGNTVDSVAARLALIGHTAGRFNTAAWVQSAVHVGDEAGALSVISSYALAVRESRRAPVAEWERELLGVSEVSA